MSHRQFVVHLQDGVLIHGQLDGQFPNARQLSPFLEGPRGDLIPDLVADLPVNRGR